MPLEALLGWLSELELIAGGDESAPLDGDDVTPDAEDAMPWRVFAALASCAVRAAAATSVAS